MLQTCILKYRDCRTGSRAKEGLGLRIIRTVPAFTNFFHEMNREVLSKYDIMTVGEMSDVSLEEALKYAGNDKNELNMVFQFEHDDLDTGWGTLGL